MEKLEFFKNVFNCLKTLTPEVLKMSLNNVHFPKLFSLVYQNTTPGKLKRIFIADKKINPFDIQYHTHRYGICLTVLKGKVLHHIAKLKTVDSFSDIQISQWNYKSPLNGGSGLSYINEAWIESTDTLIPIGASITMGVHDFHTVSCSKGSIWIVEELGFEVIESKVLGVPFTIDTLYTKPEMFQINDKIQTVKKQLKKLIIDYSSI